jgi:hypothetical protein
MLDRLVVIVVAAAAYLGLLSAHSALAAPDVTQARYMTPSQFLHSLKQVSLTLHGQGDPLDDYLPAEKARDMIQNALANRGIVVRPNSPVALEVRLGHMKGTAGETVIHDVLMDMHFYVRGTALRNGKFHVVPVAAASAWWSSYVLEPNDIQQALLLATTGNRIRVQFAQGVLDILQTIDSNDAVSTTPWPPSAWTEREKTQANTDFAKAMRADAPMDSSLILDIDVVPKLEITSELKDPACTSDSALRELWNREFQQLKWIRSVPQPSLTVRHFFQCRMEKVIGVYPYIHLIHHIYLNEANVLFEVNGELFRQNAVLASSENMSAVDQNDDDEENKAWIRKRSNNIIRLTFDDSVRYGMRERPKLPGAQLAAIVRSSPDAPPVGRVILGEDVRFEQGGWRYINGSQVPDTLLDKATGAPPLRPRTQRPVTQAPASTTIADIKNTLGTVKSCQLYAGASKENLLWSVMSPGFEMDDSGVIASRYVLSTRPGEGYAQGAAIANLSLIAAQIQDRGGCKILSIPCRNGQCVRFEDNANPSLSFFVETTDQANKILNDLKALAPLYPDGAGELRK